MPSRETTTASRSKVARLIYIVQTEHGLANGESSYTYVAFKDIDDAEDEQFAQIEKGALGATILATPYYGD